MWQAVVNYVDDVDDASAVAYRSKYEAELDDAHVGYSDGSALTESGDCIRIDGPSLWIALIMDTPYTTDGPHPHAVWRGKQDDYGGTRP